MKINKKERKKQNNAGSAIVLVIVVMALMGIMVTTILYMCLANFQMKANDLNSKNNFYTAETVLDEIRVGLQGEASAATDIAYMSVIQNYDAYSMDADARHAEFTYQYVDQLRTTLKLGNDDQKYDLDKLKSYVKEIAFADPTTGIGAEISIVDADGNSYYDDNHMVAYTSALVLKNIQVKYKDNKGYVSIITTDLRIGIPDISFESSLKIPEIVNYSLIANEQLVANNGGTTISGCVYAGPEGILAKESRGFRFQESDIIITPATVTAEKNGKITVGEDSNLWAKNVVVDSATLSMLGSSYIQDDTTVKGTASTLNIGGKYMGFGAETTQAENSSSIVINGIKSKVDLSKIKRLLLPGNTYIASGYDSITAADGKTLNNKDKMLGESLTAKASQIAYLVPSECIGWKKKENSSSYECVLGTNPVLYSKYKEFNPTFADLSGNDTTLSPLPELIEVDFSKAGVNYKEKYGASYETVFVPSDDSNDTLIYYYLKFDSQEHASKFFRDYFEENGENIAKYLDIYVDTLNVGDAEKINVAGNLLRQVEKITNEDGTTTGKYELVSETKSVDTAAGVDYSTEISVYESVFKGLSTKLVKDASTLTTEEIDNVTIAAATTPGPTPTGIPATYKGIFYNIIDVDLLNKVADAAPGHIVEFVNPDANVKAIITNNSLYEINEETPDTTSLVVAAGDVKVNREFKGTIIAGGTIQINYGTNSTAVDVAYDKDSVRKVLNITNSLNVAGETAARDITVMDFFKEGMSLATSASKDDTETDEVIIEDLVTYENWSKE